MKEDRFNIKEDWQIMPDEELRREYKRLLRLQRILSGITWAPLLPAGVYYGMTGWTSFFASEYSLFRGFDDCGTTGFVSFFIFAFCGVILSSKNTAIFKFIPLMFVGGEVMALLIFRSIPSISVLMLAYVIIASCFVHKAVEDLNFLRELPNFPFLKRRDEMNFSAMKRDDMCKYLEHIEKGGAYSVGAEEIFDSDDPESIVNPPEKTEEYFQQHKML